MPAPVNLVARKTVTYIQEGSVYKDRFTLPMEPDYGTTIRQIFLDSTGAQIGEEIVGTLDGRYVEFREPYESVAEVPNGALFYTYMNWGGADTDGEDMIRYGTVFRRQHVFPDNPGIAQSTSLKLFEDTFQRPAGAVGGRWKTLVGQPRIFDNTEWFGLGEDHPNTVGPSFTFFTSYFMYYYVPFNHDSVEISISATKKGPGKTIVSLSQNSSATSYQYVCFNGIDDTVSIGIGDSPYIGSLILPLGLDDMITPVDLEVPGDDGLGTYKIRYDDVINTLSVYEADGTTLICEWEDSSNLVPHGKGYRYFGVGGNTGLINSGVQLAYIRAAGLV